MSTYIGTEPTFGTFDKQLITGDGSSATFTLDFPVAQAGQLLVSMDGIVQEPDFAYNISLSTGTPFCTTNLLHPIVGKHNIKILKNLQNRIK